jgi:hypothetical protein
LFDGGSLTAGNDLAAIIATDTRRAGTPAVRVRPKERPMRLSLTVGALLCVLSVRGVAQEAPRFDVAGGFSLIHNLEGHEATSKGWFGGFGAKLDAHWAVVADLGGHYGGSDSVHAVLGGVRFAFGGHAVTPYVQTTVGPNVEVVEDSTFISFALQPGGGVDIWFGRFGVRSGVDYRHAFGNTYYPHWTRFYVGVVARPGG